MTDFERLRAVILEDASLRERLSAETEVGSFVTLLIDLARERGFTVTEHDVRTAIGEATRSWTARQIR
jgi:hypothetical protein